MTDDHFVNLTVRVPQSLRKAVRIQAAESDLSMGQVVCMALSQYFARPHGAAPRQKEKK